MDPNNQPNYQPNNTPAGQPVVTPGNVYPAVESQQSAPQQPQPPQPQVVAPTVGSAPGQPTTAPVAPTNPASTQNMLQIAEIRDGIVIMNDGSFRGVIMAKSINFDLMSQGEQEGVELGYQQFLNSLEFPVQIFMRSKKVDLAPYIDKLDKIRSEHDNMLLAMLMEDYIGFIEQLSEQVNIMDKTFYVIVPYYLPGSQQSAQQKLTSSKNFVTGLMDLFSHKETHVVINENNLETAKTELRNRIQSVLGGLIQCGVQGLPLDTQELIELYYDTYNPDTATRQQLKDFNNMTADVVTKGEGQARQAHLEGEL